tara:strand:- start:6118 stop:6861 length:744 start_codon:yes stop_codon:yes gene_type:complete
MPVRIDTVYQRVLTLANKEQRGYITPQEFNLLANQAQMEIFEQYFYDIKNQNRLPGNAEEYSDNLNMLYEKIGEFEINQDNDWMATNMPVTNNLLQVPWGVIYKIGTIFVNGNQVSMLKPKDFESALRLPLTKPTETRPIATLRGQGISIVRGINNNNEPIFTIPADNLNMSINYIMRPPRVQWAYVIVNDKALYNDNIAVDFELHSSEETELVYRILKLSGINLKASEVVQVGQTLEQTQIQQEKK